MEEHIEEFLRELSADWGELPPNERERRFAIAVQRLEAAVAKQVKSGTDEEAALTAALDDVRGQTFDWAVPPSTAPQKVAYTMSPNLMAGLYCLVAYKGAATLFAALFAMVTAPLMPHLLSALSAPIRPAPSGFEWPPSLILAVAAGFVLLRRDGFTGALGKLTSPGTVIADGVRWILRLQMLLFVAKVVLVVLFRLIDPDALRFVLRGDEPPLVWSILLIVTLVVLVSAPFLAGWSVASKSSTSAVEGVKIAAAAAFVLTLADTIPPFLGAGDPFALVALCAIAAVQAMYFSLGIAGAFLGSDAARKGGATAS